MSAVQSTVQHPLPHSMQQSIQQHHMQHPLHALYSDHHGWLHGWLRKKVGCGFDASDLAHDTFLRVLAVPRPDEIREPRAFLITVAHGLMVNFLRRRDLERAYLDALAAQPEALAPSPEEHAMVVEALVEIDVMLKGLAPKVRQAFLLSQLQGLRYGEIAERLGVSVSMIKKYMLQAITHCMAVHGGPAQGAARG